VHVGCGGVNCGHRAESVGGAVNCSLAGMSWCSMVGVGTVPRRACGGIRLVGWVGLGLNPNRGGLGLLQWVGPSK
jgi:hypothetical protein